MVEKIPLIGLGKQIHALSLDEEIGQPEQEQVPHRIGEELAADEIPRLALAQCCPQPSGFAVASSPSCSI
jgi:hypothetical protein